LGKATWTSFTDSLSFLPLSLSLFSLSLAGVYCLGYSKLSFLSPWAFWISLLMAWEPRREGRIGRRVATGSVSERRGRTALNFASCNWLNLPLVIDILQVFFFFFLITACYWHVLAVPALCLISMRANWAPKNGMANHRESGRPVSGNNQPGRATGHAHDHVGCPWH